MSELVGVGLDAVGERIEAGSGSHSLRHGERQFRVDKRGIRNEKRTDDGLLQLCSFIEQDCVWRNLTSRTGRGRHTDQVACSRAKQAAAKRLLYLLLSV